MSVSYILLIPSRSKLSFDTTQVITWPLEAEIMTIVGFSKLNVGPTGITISVITHLPKVTLNICSTVRFVIIKRFFQHIVASADSISGRTDARFRLPFTVILCITMYYSMFFVDQTGHGGHIGNLIRWIDSESPAAPDENSGHRYRWPVSVSVTKNSSAYC